MTALERIQREKFTVDEAAAKVGVCRETIYRWANLGVRGFRLSLFKTGYRTFVGADSLNEFLILTSGWRDEANSPATTFRTEAQQEKAARLADGKAAAAGY